MNILLYKDIILGFIRQDTHDKQIQKQIQKILENENSKHLFSKKLFVLLREGLEEEHLDQLERLFTKFSDLGTNTASNQSSQNFDEEMLHIFSSNNTKQIITLSYNEPSDEIKKSINNIAILSYQSKPNYHWLVSELASIHPYKVTARCYEFNTNTDVSQFFNDLFNIPLKISNVNIFDSQCNLDHNKFNFLTANTIKVNYFSKFKSREKDQFDRRDEIKGHFGQSANVFLIKRGNRAHGRRIIFENLTVTLDDDFWNLDVNNTDWNIDVEYCEQTANNWLNMKDLYEIFR